MKKYYIGLGDSGYLLASRLSIKDNDSQFKALDIWSPRKDKNLINLNRNNTFDYYLDNQDLVDAREWLKVMLYHNMRSHPYELSRAEIRLMYEIEIKLFKDFHNKWLIEPLEQLDDDGEIHIIIPLYDNFASAIAMLIAWDIKRNLQNRKLNMRVIADLILPDSLFFPVSSKTEMNYYYSLSTAFIKELELITDICNGNVEHGQNDVILDGRFDKVNRTLPFDDISSHGSLNKVNIKTDYSNSKDYHNMINLLVESILSKRNTITCSNISFKKRFLEQNIIFNINGYAYKTYIEYQKSLNPLISNMLHLDFRWENLFYTKEIG